MGEAFAAALAERAQNAGRPALRRRRYLVGYSGASDGLPDARSVRLYATGAVDLCALLRAAHAHSQPGEAGVE